ncbi:transglutaminase domain-containing protein [Microbacterium protaetiae]|uniref:Transglutaminase domain-containing protein n=2 Tax=Microbacterium protaetiae TaxID=2509458 RepID=A0A4P6EHD1_9MICO|nr:transglutaminase domain-containing protein [Microbacterium protaetiae]
MAAVGLLAAWPIYADPRFLVLAGAAVVVAVLISAGATVWRWPGWLTVVAGVIGVLLLGLALAVPPANLAGLPASLRDLATGALTGWKDLVTVDLPVGTYRNLLVPALMVFLGGTLGTLRLGWRTQPHGAVAAVVALLMPTFGLLFGRTVTSAAVVVGPVTIPAVRELACGVMALVISLAWLAWRTAARRRAALQRAADSSGVRLSRRRRATDTRRGVLAGGMVVLAVAAAAVVTPAVAEGRTRDVLRSGAGPAQAISQAVSPLTDYRANFGDDVVDAPLFTVRPVAGALPDRIRLATLSSYDGAQYRVAASDADGRFVRVPSRRAAAAGTEATAQVTIEGLSGIWLPTFGSIEQVQFSGQDAASAADSFYYDADAEAGVLTGGTASGMSYEITATTAAAPALASLRAPGASPSVTIPDSVTSWIEKQDAGTGGAALATLVQRLRERGYLSHALTVPDTGAAWMKQLGDGYVFQPSTSGHSLARIDTMFRRLLARQADADAGSLVAAAGDDEQFAVAVSLIAEKLGFPARVVVGARLSGDDTDLSVCADGVCTGGDITAWTEVRDASGQWVAVDVTPQHTEGADTAVTKLRDPENATDVRSENAEEVDPPDPTKQDSTDSSTHDDQSADLSSVWALLRIGGIALAAALVLIGPFAAILAAKAVRRRSRRHETSPAARVVGGWEEYVDVAVDHGKPMPGNDTRTEVAERYGTPAATVLAVEADRAVFWEGALTDDESQRFWNIIDQERRRMAASVPLWRRMLAAVSLKSFTRGVTPRSVRRRDGAARTLPGTERRGRGRQAASAEE